MAYTPEQLQALKDAITAEQEVEFADRRVRYRSISEISEAIGIVEPSVSASSGTPRIRQIRITSDKGF